MHVRLLLNLKLDHNLHLIISVLTITIFLYVYQFAYPQTAEEDIIFEHSPIEGIRLSYPSSWEQSGSNLEDCYKKICSFRLAYTQFYAKIFIKSIPPIEYTQSCNCTNITEYLKSVYDEYYGDKSDYTFEFVNDNLTLIDNRTAIQMEFGGGNYLNIIIYTQNEDIFYIIDYLTARNDNFERNLSEFRKIIDSIQFIEMDKPKQPSFM